MIGREAFALLAEGRLPKGDPLAMAEVAGIQAAKQTPALIPLCHPIALNRVIEFKKRGVDGIYLNGDIMDLGDVSRFEKMPDARYLRDEIEVARSFVKSLRKLFPDIPIFWKDGNHEKRLESYVASKAPELVKLFGMDIPTQLELADHGLVHIPEHKVSRFGKLWIAHGHELGLKSGTVNIARQVRMRVGVNVIFRH